MSKRAVVLFFGLLAAAFLLPEQVQAQREVSYRSSAGVRISPFYGATFKHFLQRFDAVEGILHTRWNALKVTGLYEKHVPVFEEPGMRFFFGGGGHLGFLSGRYYGDSRYSNSQALLGLDGILGLEYTVQNQEIPLNLALDWKPVLELSPVTGFWGWEIGISARYIFRFR